MICEVWADIPGFEEQYQASSTGRIRSLERVVFYKDGRKRLAKGQILRPAKAKSDPYLSVSLGRGAMHHVHSLIARTFIGSPSQGMDVCHKNGNREDNSVENLRYDTRSENNMDVYRIGDKTGKLDLGQIKQIYYRSNNGERATDLAEEYKVSRSNIYSIKNGGYKTCTLFLAT